MTKASVWTLNTDHEVWCAVGDEYEDIKQAVKARAYDENVEIIGKTAITVLADSAPDESRLEALFVVSRRY